MGCCRLQGKLCALRTGQQPWKKLRYSELDMTIDVDWDVKPQQIMHMYTRLQLNKRLK